MKIEIEKSEYDRLKSREEKLMAYYEWFVDKENDLATVEDIVNKNIKLEEENKKLKEENEIQKKLNLWERMEYLKCIEELKEENQKLRLELELKNLALTQIQEWSILI